MLRVNKELVLSPLTLISNQLLNPLTKSYCILGRQMLFLKLLQFDLLLKDRMGVFIRNYKVLYGQLPRLLLVFLIGSAKYKKQYNWLMYMVISLGMVIYYVML